MFILLALIGPSSSGKSALVQKILQELPLIFTVEVKKILLCYNVKTDIHKYLEENIPNIELRQGLPSAEELEDFLGFSDNKLLVLDDLYTYMTENKAIDSFLTVGSHNSNSAIIYTSQVLFSKNKYSKSVSINTHIFLLLNSSRSFNQIQIFARQLLGGTIQYKTFMSLWNEQIAKSLYSYLVVNCFPSVPQHLRLTTDIFSDKLTRVFLI